MLKRILIIILISMFGTLSQAEEVAHKTGNTINPKEFPHAEEVLPKKVDDKIVIEGSVEKKTSSPATGAKSMTKNLAMHQRIIQHSLEMANLKPNQCRWPIGDPDSEGFHFCGAPVFVGKPYCYEHCKQAYQFTPPKKKQA